MISTFSIILGTIGTFLAFIEIWYPATLKRIENIISNHLENTVEFRSLLRKEIEEIRTRGQFLRSELSKGFQPILPHELKDRIMDLFYYVKKSMFIYLALSIYIGILKPIKTLLTYTSKLGKGRFIGGMGILLNLIGLTLSIISV